MSVQNDEKEKYFGVSKISCRRELGDEKGYECKISVDTYPGGVLSLKQTKKYTVNNISPVMGDSINERINFIMDDFEALNIKCEINEDRTLMCNEVKESEIKLKYRVPHRVATVLVKSEPSFFETGSERGTEYYKSKRRQLWQKYRELEKIGVSEAYLDGIIKEIEALKPGE